jgi:hypothetical protein
MNKDSGGSEAVSVARDGDLMVVSCAAGWTTADWNEALQPYQHITADLAGMSDEVDGTEIFFFTVASEVAA